MGKKIVNNYTIVTGNMIGRRTLPQKAVIVFLVLFLLNYVIISSLNCKTYTQFATTFNQKQISVPSCHPQPAPQTKSNKQTGSDPISCNFCIAISGGFGFIFYFTVLIVYCTFTLKKTHPHNNIEVATVFASNCKSRAPPEYAA